MDFHNSFTAGKRSKLWKSVKKWWSYRNEFGVLTFFETQYIYMVCQKVPPNNLLLITHQQFNVIL